MVEIKVVFGCELTWTSSPHSSTGGDDQRAVRADEYVTHRFDNLSVLLAVRDKGREVVIEGTVDYTVRLGGSAA